MILKGLDYLIESVISKFLDIVIPSGKVKPSNTGFGLFIEDINEAEIKGSADISGWYNHIQE